MGSGMTSPPPKEHLLLLFPSSPLASLYPPDKSTGCTRHYRRRVGQLRSLTRRTTFSAVAKPVWKDALSRQQGILLDPKVSHCLPNDSVLDDDDQPLGQPLLHVSTDTVAFLQTLYQVTSVGTDNIQLLTTAIISGF